jgi:hypothetical protein
MRQAINARPLSQDIGRGRVDELAVEADRAVGMLAVTMSCAAST